VHAEDILGNRSVSRIELQIDEVAWPEGGKLKLKPRPKAPSGDMLTMRQTRDAAFVHPDPVQHWSGPFSRPMPGVLTSPYGSFRTYPDGSRSYHDALDISKRRGTPVTAAAAGVVRMATTQPIHGNAVIVGHGQQVSTLYSHLSRIDVTEGQVIPRGTQLGLEGSTGRVTGPHLHFGVVVNGVAVNPNSWLEHGYGQTELRRAAPLTLLDVSPDPRPPPEAASSAPTSN
jgi:murein DD-endopeptidase MepM/ murein hydrolase activator NlpD